MTEFWTLSLLFALWAMKVLDVFIDRFLAIKLGHLTTTLNFFVHSWTNFFKFSLLNHSVERSVYTSVLGFI